jgi:uncharacterized caspase-like protein
MVRLDLVHRTMERESNTNILIMDACRDNPLARNLARALGTRSTQIGRGLAAVESGEGTLISFSTQPGNVALDGTGRNSPYAAALLKHIAIPGDDLPTILINVRTTSCRRRIGDRCRESVAEALLRDMQGTAAEKLALFEKLKARGGFAGEDRAEILKVERMLRTFAATEK